MSGSDPGLGFRVEAVARDYHLHVRYVVRNDAARDVYLLNRLFRASPPDFGPDIAYVEFDRPDRVVVVSKRIADVPPGMNPTSLVVPYVTPVRVGQTFTETFKLALPLRVILEYGRAQRPLPPEQERITEYRGMRFRLAYYWRDDGVTETPGVAFDQPVVIPGNFPRFPPILELVSPVVPVPLPVIEPP